MTELSFWQKYFRNELIAVELILNSGDPELFYGISRSYVETKRKEVIDQLIRIQINEYSSTDE